MEIRTLNFQDAPRLQELSQLVKWNHTLADCEFMLQAPWIKFIGFEDSGQLIATAGMPIYGEFAMGFINLVIVHPAYRRRGLATELIKNLLHLEPRVKSFRLHATPEGSLVYRKLGFEVTRNLSFFSGEVSLPQPAESRAVPLTRDDLERITQLDAQSFGLPRRDLWRDNLRRFGDLGLKIETNGYLQGFALGRRGRKYRQIATVEAADAATALALIAQAGSLEATLPLNLVCFAADHAVIAPIQRAGFTKVRELIEMEYGVPGPVPGASYHAIYGGDFG